MKTFLFTVKDSKATMNADIRNHIKNLKDGEYILTIKKRYNGRTLQQNAYYWACMTVIGHETEMEPRRVHDGFKAMFLMDYSTKIPSPGSTKDLSTMTFSEYFDKIKLYCAEELGIMLPEANDNLISLFLPND